jgi:hypothetical protein
VATDPTAGATLTPPTLLATVCCLIGALIASHAIAEEAAECIHKSPAPTTRVNPQPRPPCTKKSASMPDRRLSILRALLAMAFVISNASADEAAQCIQRQVAFDGITPIQYATATNPSGKIYLHPQYPAQCTGAPDEDCKASAYILPGDALGIGKTCGSWAYVQYVGEKHITTGWAATTQLTIRNQTETSSTSPTETIPNKAQAYRFRLTQGVGVPVCAAYLQRLNSTSYTLPPYCGRPENDSVPGFTKLPRVSLAATQVPYWAPKVLMFLLNQAQGELPLGYPPETLSTMLGTRLLAWKYATPIDIANNDQPVDILMWQGVGVDQTLQGECGRESFVFSDHPIIERAAQMGFALTPDGRHIDGEKTKSLLGHPLGGYYDSIALAVGARGKPASPRFRPLGDSLGIFRYRGTYYLDTFLDPEWGDLQGKRTGRASLENTLAVVLRHGGQWEETCEYRMTTSAQATAQ